MISWLISLILFGYGSALKWLCIICASLRELLLLVFVHSCSPVCHWRTEKGREREHGSSDAQWIMQGRRSDGDEDRNSEAWCVISVHSALKLAALKVFFPANTDSISMFSAYDDAETLLKRLTNWYNLYVSDLRPLNPDLSKAGFALWWVSCENRMLEMWKISIAYLHNFHREKAKKP